MEKYSVPQHTVRRYFSPPRPIKTVLKTSSIISNETISSSGELDDMIKNRKKLDVKETVQQKIKKAQLLCQSIKRSTMSKGEATCDHTKASLLENMKHSDNLANKQRNHYSSFRLKKGLSMGDYETPSNSKLKSASSLEKDQYFSARAIKEESLEKEQVDVRQSPEGFNRNDSPRKQELRKKRKRNALLAYEINHLSEARAIESLIISQNDDNDELQISYVEEQGAKVLDWTICKGKASQFKVLKFIDEGRYGKVYLAQSYRNSLIYSIKTLYRSTMEDDSLNQLVRQVKIQSFLNHPNIVKLYNFFVDQQSAYLVLEPCLGKNLYQNLKENGRIPEKTAKQYIRQICTAVQYMHNHDIIHRDLKPQNILLHENTIKICDFGWAIYSPLLRGTQCGTPIYTSPEVVNKQPYDSKIDIWSIGVLTYELLYGTIPFEIRHIDDLIKITQQEVYFSQEIMVSEAAKDFMAGCLNKDPYKRYRVRQLLEHQFLSRISDFRRTIC